MKLLREHIRITIKKCTPEKMAQGSNSVRQSRNILLCGIFSLFVFSLNAQSRFFQPADSIHKGRLIGTSAGVGTAWAGSMLALNHVWYSGFPQVKFHSFDDSKEWLQMDKAGHIYTAYHISDKVAKLYKWSGMSNTGSALIGAGVGWGFQFSLELLDAKSAAWGFSWSDMTANTIGTGIYLAQQLTWQEQKIKLKFSYSPTEYPQYRPEVLGATFPERLLKDYNGQTYWLSFSPGNLFPGSGIPPWLCIAAGYSIDGKLKGLENEYWTTDGRYFEAKREFVLSLDIDVTKLNIKKQWLRTLLSPFNMIKVPFPALLWRGGTLYGKPFYF